MRTQEQIVADCERRMKELQEEAERRANDPNLTRPCNTCRWHSWRWEYLEEGPQCSEPLIKGFSSGPIDMGMGKKPNRIPPLCGPEKALWIPVPTRFERIIEWFKTIHI